MTTRQPNDKIKLNYYYYWKDRGEEDTVSGVSRKYAEHNVYYFARVLRVVRHYNIFIFSALN